MPDPGKVVLKGIRPFIWRQLQVTLIPILLAFSGNFDHRQDYSSARE